MHGASVIKCELLRTQIDFRGQHAPAPAVTVYDHAHPPPGQSVDAGAALLLVSADKYEIPTFEVLPDLLARQRSVQLGVERLANQHGPLHGARVQFGNVKVFLVKKTSHLGNVNRNGQFRLCGPKMSSGV